MATPGCSLVGIAMAAVLLLLLAAPDHCRASDQANGASDPPALVVDADFANGNGRVESLDQRARIIRLSPVEHQQRGWACWWYVKVTGIRPGETITLDVGKGPWATPARASFSLDNQNWCQTSDGVRQQDRFVYRQRIDADEAWFAWGLRLGATLGSPGGHPLPSMTRRL